MNEYYVPGFTGYLQRSVLEGGGGSTLESLPATVDPLTGELVYAPPTAQPVMAEPVPAAYSLPTAQPVMAEAAPAYGLPTEQPVVAEPAPAEAAPIDLGGWSLENFQKQFMQDGASAALRDFIGKQAAEGKLYTSPIGDSLTNAVLMPSVMDSLLNLYGATPEEQALRYFMFQGRDQQSGTTANPIVMRDEHTGGYRLVDDKTGKVLGTAANAEQLEALLGQAAGIRGAKDIYSLQALGSEGEVVDTLYQQKAKDTLGDLLVQMGALALPAVGAGPLGKLLAGALGTSGAVGAGLGAAVGSAASGVTAGKSIGDILKGAALTGLSTFGMAQLLNSLGIKPPAGGNSAAFRNDLISLGVDPSTASGIATNLTGALAGALPSDIVVAGNLGGLGSSALAPATGALTSGALAALGQGSNLAETAKQPQKQPLQEQFADASQGLTVFGDRGAALVSNALPGALPGTLAGALNAAQLSGTNYGDQLWGEQQQQPEQPPETQDPNAIEVAGQKTPAPTSGVPVPVSGVVPSIPTVDPVYGEIVVSNKYKPPSVDDRLAAMTAAAAPILNTPTPTTPTTPTAENKKGLDIVDYLRLAGLGIGALGNLFGGGGGGQSNFRVPGGMGSLHPSFGARLPTANLPGLTGGTAAAPRTAANLGTQGLRTPQDYYRYGYGPEQSFFNYVPEAEKNTSTAYTGYAEGGFAVEGPGDGRDDKIPAMLSDGEYVIDAETVALLGNGSNKAGADMLDQFRVNVRKHKGRDLMRGEFSKNAKRPERYLAGGRA